jgi:hypothetical protein
MQLIKDLEQMRIGVTLQTLPQYTEITGTDTTDTSKSTKYTS